MHRSGITGDQDYTDRKERRENQPDSGIFLNHFCFMQHFDQNYGQYTCKSSANNKKW